MKHLLGVVIAACWICGGALLLPCQAGLTAEEKKVWGASENAPLLFLVPSNEGTAIMGKAQGIVSDWNSYDRYMHGMKIQTVTENLIETYNPTEIGGIGFRVTRTSFPQGDEIGVDALYYTGNLFSDERKDALKRAHLLSYILQVFAKQMMPSPTPSAPVASSDNKVVDKSPLADDFELYMKLIRNQLADAKYSSALATLATFRSAIEDKQKAANTAPVAAAQPSIQPALTLAMPSDVLKK